MDGMNGIVYVDDSQVVEIHTTKVYAETGGVDILITEKE
jgi:Holliday junction resolvase RusA-like endonuclease